MKMMENIERSRIRNSTTTKPFLTSFDWDLEIISLPNIVSNSGHSSDVVNQYLRSRSITVVVPEEPTNTTLQTYIRGHRFSQMGDTPAYGNLSIIVQDFADTAIQSIFQKMLYEASDPVTKAVNGNPIKDYIFDMNIYRLDPERNVVKTWRCRDCYVYSCNVNETMSNDRAIVGDSTIGIMTDFFTVEYNVSGNDTTSYYNFQNNTLNPSVTGNSN